MPKDYSLFKDRSLFVNVIERIEKRKILNVHVFCY